MEFLILGALGGGVIGGAGIGTFYYRRLKKTMRKQGFQINTIEQLYNEVQRTSSALDQNYIETIEALVRALEARDMYTAGHSDRVNRYSVAIATKLGLTEEEIEAIHHGSLLHDIGKIGVYDNILLKPKALTDEEFEIMKSHPDYGVGILKNVKSMEKHLPIILHHHERQDGSGYPYGLKGDAIPLGARIVQVADTWDAMRSDRPYRRKLSLEVATSNLRKASGTQLDEDCVEAFLSCIHPKTGGLMRNRI